MGEHDNTTPPERIALTIGLLGLLVGGAVVLATLVGDDGESDQLVIDATSTTRVPAATFDASIDEDDIRITDEPIVIDADGNIVDPTNADATAGDDVQQNAEPRLSLPDDAFTAADRSLDQAGEAADTAEPDDAGGIDLLGGDDPEDKLMPDLICRGLQAAQDEIQDHGVFGSKSKDATGQGRRQIWDRNWVVVGQEPEPGERIGEFEAVLYVVKKSDDENPCD